MKVTAYRIAQNGYDAMIIGFERPCVISLYKCNVSPLCGSGSNNDNNVFRYASHPEQQPEGAMPNCANYIYHEGMSAKDFYAYFSTICLDHLTHEQHKAMYSAVAEINDVTDRCLYSFPAEGQEEQEYNDAEMRRTDIIKVNLKKCHLKFADGTKATYNNLH